MVNIRLLRFNCRRIQMNLIIIVFYWMLSKNKILLVALLLVATFSQITPNCAIHNGLICVICNAGYFFNVAGACIRDPNCILFSPADFCLACQAGYIITIPVSSNTIFCIPSSDPNCTSYSLTGLCTQCSDGYFINGDGVTGNCTFGNPYCRTFTNNGAGQCASCYQGYTFSNSACIIGPPRQNPYCISFGGGSSCTSCLSGFYINSNGICTYGDPYCQVYTPGLGSTCLTCFTSFTLSNGKCSTTPIATVKFPYCAKFCGTICCTCFSGYLLSSSGVSTKCSLGGNLRVVNNDPFCAILNGTVCTKCMPGFYISGDGYNGKCTFGNQLCASFVIDGTGKCGSCYSSYLLLAGKCIPSSTIDPFCARFINNTTTCSSCSLGYYINLNGKCTFGNTICASLIDGTGKCGSCRGGYILVAGNCLLKSSLDPYCDIFVLGTSTCSVCLVGYYINGNGVTGKCTFGNQYCKFFTTDGTGRCSACWPGYSLSQLGVCSFGSLPNDPYCAAVNGSICLKCYVGYFINGNGITGRCVAGNQLCSNYTNDGSGKCGGCWPGYTLQAGNCVVTSSLNLPRDPFCSQFGSGTTCISCYIGYFVNVNVDGKCAPANQFCKTYAMLGGSCLTCHNPYRLSGKNPNTCVYP